MKKAVFLLFFLCGSAKTEIYLVGPTKPYTQLQQVTDLLNPGDTVFVDGDNIYTGGVSFTRAGTPSEKIAVIGVRINGSRPVISGGINTVAFISPWPYENGADHYIFQGFEVTEGTSRGIYHQADDLTIRDVLVRDCPAHGILGADQGSGSCLIEFVEVRNCGEGDRRHQIYMATDEVHHPGSVFRMQFCYIHDANGGNNVKSRAERNEIYYNWIEGAFYHELELIGCDEGDTGNIHLKREDSDVVGNVLLKKATSSGNNPQFYVTRIGGDGTGMTHGRYRFVNNTIICGTSAVFRCFDTLECLEVHNNVFYRQGGEVNIIRTQDAFWVHDTAVITGSNNWVFQGALNIPTQWTGTIEGADPGFVDYSTFDLRISAGSPLVNSGNSSLAGPVGMPFPNPLFPPVFHPPLLEIQSTASPRPIWGTIDIGAFEYSPTPVEELTLKDEAEDVFIDVISCDGTQGDIRLRFFLQGNRHFKVLVFDITGRCIARTGGLSDISGETEVVFYFEKNRRQSSGCYFAVLENDKFRSVHPFQIVF
ncbi:hypothetical protein JW890_03320 [candidate division WOR-3 bacterium]|nr:hypothetical protein [candidate division WOR-3 bacterium]